VATSGLIVEEFGVLLRAFLDDVAGIVYRALDPSAMPL
jgi:hypothetical protein